MKTLLQKIFHFVLFSSLYVACCAVLLMYQANRLLHLQYPFLPGYLFVFFSTICSYNFHWYLTPQMHTEQIRIKWTQQHKALHLFLFIAGGIGGVLCALYFVQHWRWLGIAVLLTFLYSAPKVSYYPFTLLRRVAIGKTIFLAFVWMYVTTVLPLVFSGKSLLWQDVLFCASRFFFIYSVCIVFDYRDRESDKKEGIKSLITYLSEQGINYLFYATLVVFAAGTLALHYAGYNTATIAALLVPGVCTLLLYKYLKKNFSDYLYYFVLDGLVMFSPLITLFMSIT